MTVIAGFVQDRFDIRLDRNVGLDRRICPLHADSLHHKESQHHSSGDNPRIFENSPNVMTFPGDRIVCHRYNIAKIRSEMLCAISQFGAYALQFRSREGEIHRMCFGALNAAELHSL